MERLLQLHALVKSQGGAARCLGHAEAVLAHDVAVRKRGQEAEINRERCPARVRCPRQSCCEQRFAQFEDILKIASKLPGDPIPIRGGCHRVPQRDGRRLKDVVLLDAAETSRRGLRDRAVCKPRVLDVERLEYPRECRAQAWRPTIDGCGQRCAEQDNAEIGIGTNRRERRLDGGQNPGTDAGTRLRDFAICPGSQPAMQNTPIALASRIISTIQARIS